MNRQILGRLTEVRQWRNLSPSAVGESDNIENQASNDKKGNGDNNDSNSNMSKEPVIRQGTDPIMENLDDIKNAEVELDPNRPKRPFLKKGCGLARYNMKREDFIIYNNKSVRRTKRPNLTSKPKVTVPSDKPNIGEKKITPTPIHTRTPSNKYRKSNQKYSDSKTMFEQPSSIETNNNKWTSESPKILKSPSQENIDESPTFGDFVLPSDLEPLRLPSMAVKYNGRWFSGPIDEASSPAFYDVIGKNVPVQSIWKDEGTYINDKNENPEQTSAAPNDAPDPQNQEALDTSANELRAFESLERRVEQSGFCSKDNSIIQLLTQIDQEDQSNCAFGGDTRANDEYQGLWRTDFQMNFKESIEGLEGISGVYYERPPSSTDNAENLSSDIDTDYQESEKSDLSDYGSRDGRSTSVTSSMVEQKNDGKFSPSNEYFDPVSDDPPAPISSMEICQAIQWRESPDASDYYCDRCSSLIASKLKEYSSEVKALATTKMNLEIIKEDMETKMLEFEMEVKIKRREIDEMRAILKEKLQNDGQSLNKESKTLQIELSKAKQELASLKIELKETRDYMNVRESNNGVRNAKMRNTINELEKINANLRSEIAILKADMKKIAAREQQALKSAQMNMLRQVANDVNDLKKTTKNLQLGHNVSKGAVKKVPVTYSSEKGNMRIEELDRVKALPAIEMEDRVTKTNTRDTNATKKFPPRLSYKKREKVLPMSQDSSEELSQKQEMSRQQCSTEKKVVEHEHLIKQPENNPVIKGLGSIRKTMFYRRGENPAVIEAAGVCRNQDDDAIIEDILEEISESCENENKLADTQEEQLFDDGSREIRYLNGNIKIITSQCIVRYYYASKDIWQTHNPDGTEILEFPSGKRDERNTNKIFHVEYTDGLVHTKYFDYTVVQYPDGSFLKRNDVTGNCVLYMPNGDKEIHGSDYKSRLYSDGTIKTVFNSGYQETRYANGRIRVKTNTGDVILDTFDNVQ